jgi:hypothetical protein
MVFQKSLERGDLTPPLQGEGQGGDGVYHTGCMVGGVKRNQPFIYVLSFGAKRKYIRKGTP